MDAATRAAWNAAFEKGLPFFEAERIKLRTNVRGVQIVDYASTSHHFFLKVPDQVVTDVEAFLGPA